MITHKTSNANVQYRFELIKNFETDVLRCSILVKCDKKFKVADYMNISLYKDTTYGNAKNILLEWANARKNEKDTK